MAQCTGPLLVVFCVCLVGLHALRLKQGLEAQRSCQQCLCDCLFAIIPTGLSNISLSDCGEEVPELKEELRKDLLALTTEELGLLKTVANETLERTEALISHAGSASSHYRREAEKCGTGVGARERAESQLVEERMHSALWEDGFTRSAGKTTGDDCSSHEEYIQQLLASVHNSESPLFHSKWKLV